MKSPTVTTTGLLLITTTYLMTCTQLIASSAWTEDTETETSTPIAHLRGGRIGRALSESADAANHNNKVTLLDMQLGFFSICTFQALVNKEECLNTQTMGNDPQQWCQFCTLVANADDEEAGLCVSPQQAAKSQESLPGKFVCETHLDRPLLPLAQDSNPNGIRMNDDITLCNIEGLDRERCLDPTQVSGSKCTWCDVGIGGFCFPESWKHSAIEFFKCTSTLDTTMNMTPTNHVDDSLMKIASQSSPSSSWDFFTSSCYKNATDHDDCVTMKDDESDEPCVWCDAYVFGLCLNPQEATKVGSFLSCEPQQGKESNVYLDALPKMMNEELLAIQ
jgi:hypothetical protein